MASKLSLKNGRSELSIVHKDGQPAKTIYTDGLTNAVDTIADMEALITGTDASAYDGNVCFVKDLTRGGSFIYDSTKVSEDNQGTNFNGWVRQYDGAVNVKWFGAKGDDTVDDTDAIQAALNISNNVYIPEGQYLISRNSTTDGASNYGLKIENNGTTIYGVKGKTLLKRYDTDITTYALAYPIIFIGHPEMANTGTISDVVLKDFDIIGEDTRHSLQGNIPNDLRTAIQVKGAINLSISRIKFDAIDSTAIYFMQTRTYSYITSTTYNINVYNELCSIQDCTFYGNPHTVTARALLHAVVISGCDGINISNNMFSWCDDAINGNSTYPLDKIYEERNIATYIKDSVTYKCSGREVVIANNDFRNSSEHTIYLAVANASVTGNTVNVDNAHCQGDFKIRGTHISITGNSLVCHYNALSIQEISRDIIVDGNTFRVWGENTDGVIGIQAINATTWVDNRPWIDTTNGYPRCENITVSNNLIKMNDSTLSYGIGIRLYTNSSSEAAYPDGTLANVRITGNTFKNVKSGVMFTCPNLRDSVVSNNSFFGASFTKDSFDGSDLKSYATMTISDNYPYNMLRCIMNGNRIVGFKYVFGILKSDGTAGGGQSGIYYRPPVQFVGNDFEYLLDISEQVGEGYWRAMGYDPAGQNRGRNLVARNTMLDTIPNNSLSLVSDYNSGKKNMYVWDGTHLCYFYNDSGDYKQLDN